MTRLLLSAAVALLHITPTVVLIKREDAVRRILPAATSFTARDIRLSRADAHRLHEALDWGPDDGILTLYTGRKDRDAIGALAFMRVDTPHGPIEVAVGFNPSGAITQVAVTKATTETKAWVQQAVRSGVLDGYVGLTAARVDLQTLPKAQVLPGGTAGYRGKVGRMAGFILEQIDKGVARALVAYGWFYRS